MKKRLMVGLIVALLVAVPVVAFAGHATGAQANLLSVNGSGITATITFTDDGSTLTVNGTATGLVPDTVYLSLIYDKGSVPRGPRACEPTFAEGHPFDIETTMLVGFWSNDGQGNGVLNATDILPTPPGAGDPVYVPLDNFRTISIREFVQQARPELRACGLVVPSR